MTKEECLKFFDIKDLMYLPDAVWTLLNSPIKERDEKYKELIELNNYDMGIEWFQPIYEAELSERKQKKQDFTPKELSKLCSKLTLQRGSVHEPTAGNGSMIIADWWERCRQRLPWEMFPSENMVTAWELSDRAIPILLLNLSIRGIMGYVYHGDVLEQNVFQKYILLNKKNDGLGFSEVVKVNKNQLIKQL
mgnify:CR=1 FL=1